MCSGKKWEDDVVDAVIELINKSNLKLKEDVLVIVEEKFERRLTEELSKVALEISKVNERISKEISGVNERITTEISSVNQRISESHANLIKWMFIFWVGQIGVILGILFAFFK